LGGAAPQDSPHLCWHKSLEEAAVKAEAALEVQKGKPAGSSSTSQLQQDSIDHSALIGRFSAMVSLIPSSTACQTFLTRVIKHSTTGCELAAIDEALTMGRWTAG